MKIVPLNLMLSYPVKWKKQQVLRDIVQNFYDDIGANDFSKKFKKVYINDNSGGKIVLSAVSDGFNYEWLLHIGASTKQVDVGKYAGFFGEGFKIASLCALRDYSWKIKMRAREWSVEVCVMDTDIDGKVLKQLAYTIEEGLDFSPETILTIDHFSEEDAALLDSVVLGFYYPENPLFGKLIFKNEYAAIYERSNIQKPEKFAFSFDLNGDGIIFVGFQARGEFVKPLIICNHRFKTPDRERNNIFKGTVLDVLIDIVDLIDDKTSCYLLKQLEKFWYDYPDKEDDMKSWYPVIRKLVRKLTYHFSDSYIVDEFIKSHPNLVVCERPTSTHTRNQKTQALVWMKNNLPESKLVQDSFQMLGYKTIVDLCKDAGGFNITREANDRERQILDILQKAAQDIFDGFIIDFPKCLVIENDSSVYSGKAHIIKSKKLLFNNRGLKIKYTLPYIEIKKSLLIKSSFKEAFSTYCHELCHCFGGDASITFSRALTYAITFIMESNERLLNFHRLWVTFFDNDIG